MAGLLGGTDVDDWQVYEEENTDQYYNKGNHRLRSLFHRPKHAEHYKKEEMK